MGPFGPESNLRLYGLAIAARGSKNAKKRAAMAVARNYLEALRQAVDLEEKNQQLQRREIENGPKLRLVQTIVASSDSILIGEYGKAIKDLNGIFNNWISNKS